MDRKKTFLLISKLLIGLVAGFICVFTLTSQVFAQVGSLSADTDTINVKPSSQYYEPNSTVEMTVLSRLINLNDKRITWTVNGEVVDTGFGITSIKVPTGTSQNPTVVGFRANLPAQGVVTRQVELNPVEVDLILESRLSYVPPFYKGKALNPGWGKVSITAIPHVYREGGAKYSREELFYKWEYNGIVYGDKSGKGQSSITVNTTPRNNRMAVEIRTPGDQLVARDFINFPRSEPQVLFYEQSNTQGVMLSKSLEDTTTMQSSDSQIVGFPYFFLAKNADAQKLGYNWSFNGQDANTLSEKNIIDITDITNESGYLSLRVTDRLQVLFPEYENRLRISSE